MDLKMTLAYLDPGTGSLIMQAVLGGIAGLAVFFKATGRRIFGRNKPQTDQQNAGESVPAADD